MTVFRAHGVIVSLFWKPVRDVLQRWRICLASLVFFTIFLTNNFGVSTGADGLPTGGPGSPTGPGSPGGPGPPAPGTGHPPGYHVPATGRTSESDHLRHQAAAALRHRSHVSSSDVITASSPSPPPPSSSSSSSSLSSSVRSPSGSERRIAASRVSIEIVTSPSTSGPSSGSRSPESSPPRTASRHPDTARTSGASLRHPGAARSAASGSSSSARRRHISEWSSFRDRPYSASGARDQCLVADDLASEVCSLPADWQYDCPRTRRMRQLHLSFCGSFPLYAAILVRKGGRECPLDEESEAECRRIIGQVVDRDNEAREMYCLFRKIASRFDCVDPFSAEWSCDHCKEAYKNWVCSKTIPYYHEDTQLEPCPRYCELVENRCPYIKPHLLDTYAGEQTFICRDWDDIPRQFISGTAEWVDEPEVVSYVKCHQPCPTDVRSTNTTNICISQMEKTVGVSVDVEVEPGVPTPRHATVLPPADEHVNRTEDATSARSGSGTSALPTFWISYLLAGFTLFSGCPDVAHVTLLVSYHRVIGLT